MQSEELSVLDLFVASAAKAGVPVQAISGQWRMFREHYDRTINPSTNRQHEWAGLAKPRCRSNAEDIKRNDGDKGVEDSDSVAAGGRGIVVWLLGHRLMLAANARKRNRSGETRCGPKKPALGGDGHKFRMSTDL